MELKFNTEEIDAVAIMVDLNRKNALGETLYFEDFTAIYNTYRENPDILSFRNYSDSTLKLIFEKDSAEEGKKWLAHFGDIKSVEEVLFIRVEDDFENPVEDSKGRFLEYGLF